MQLGTWSAWYTGNFILNLHAAQCGLESRAAAAGQTVAQLVQGTSSEPTLRSQWQKRCRELLARPSQVCTTRELSRSLSRLPLLLFPCRRTPRALEVLRGLAPSVPP